MVTCCTAWFLPENRTCLPNGKPLDCRCHLARPAQHPHQRGRGWRPRRRGDWSPVPTLVSHQQGLMWLRTSLNFPTCTNELQAMHQNWVGVYYALIFTAKQLIKKPPPNGLIGGSCHGRRSRTACLGSSWPQRFFQPQCSNYWVRTVKVRSTDGCLS